jgi:type I restriction enzyme, R subunit
LAGDSELIQQAKVNTLDDFKSALSDKIDDAVIDSTIENQNINNELLSSEDLKKAISGVFTEKFYSRLREEKGAVYGVQNEVLSLVAEDPIKIE